MAAAAGWVGAWVGVDERSQERLAKGFDISRWLCYPLLYLVPRTFDEPTTQSS